MGRLMLRGWIRWVWAWLLPPSAPSCPPQLAARIPAGGPPAVDPCWLGPDGGGGAIRHPGEKPWPCYGNGEAMAPRALQTFPQGPQHRRWGFRTTVESMTQWFLKADRNGSTNSQSFAGTILQGKTAERWRSAAAGSRTDAGAEAVNSRLKRVVRLGLGSARLSIEEKMVPNLYIRYKTDPPTRATPKGEVQGKAHPRQLAL